MYTVDRAVYGFAITLADKVSREEAVEALNRSRELLAVTDGPFGVLVDIRALRPLSPDVQTIVNATQRLYLDSGLERSTVILASALMTLQFRRIATESGVKQHERYVDGSAPDSDRIALAWVVDGVEPVLEHVA